MRRRVSCSALYREVTVYIPRLVDPGGSRVVACLVLFMRLSNRTAHQAAIETRGSRALLTKLSRAIAAVRRSRRRPAPAAGRRPGLSVPG